MNRIEECGADWGADRTILSESFDGRQDLPWQLANIVYRLTEAVKAM